MELQIMCDKVYTGENDLGFYSIWPSAKHPGYYYVDRVMKPSNSESCYAEGNKRPMSVDGVSWWINYYASNVVWKSTDWDGKEFSFYSSKDDTSKKDTVVYFIEAIGTGFVKIGRGKYRIDSLQTGCPFELRLLHEIETDNIGLEKELHARFNQDHYRGEWFYLSNSILSFINGEVA